MTQLKLLHNPIASLEEDCVRTKPLFRNYTDILQTHYDFLRNDIREVGNTKSHGVPTGRHFRSWLLEVLIAAREKFQGIEGVMWTPEQDITAQCSVVSEHWWQPDRDFKTCNVEFDCYTPTVEQIVYLEACKLSVESNAIGNVHLITV
jgi:hypothetical protein